MASDLKQQGIETVELETVVLTEFDGYGPGLV